MPVPTKNVITFTIPKDIHACSVDYVLRAMGTHSIMFNTVAVPSGEHITVKYWNDRPVLRIGGFECRADEITATWNRRFSRIFSLPANIHPADVKYIRESSNAVLTGLLCLLDDRFPVNPVGSARFHSNKLNQLRLAQVAGFQVPKTLISNSFDDIDSFLGAVGDACVKPYRTQGWKTDDGDLHSVTTRIDRTMKFDRASYEIAPHIFQQYIAKKAEYRLTVFGNYSAAIRIDTQALKGHSLTDWRFSPAYLAHLSPCDLPEPIVAAARRLLSMLGLRFGSFDIAETADGDYFFFEVNEAGQWLWKESHCPDCRMLQPFCEYLLSADDDFIWDRRRASAEFDVSTVYAAVERDGRYTALMSADFPDDAEFTANEQTT